jgi:hypothetical protein
MNRSPGRRWAAWFALAGASPAVAAPVEVVPGTPEVSCPDPVAVQGALLAQVGDGAPARGWRLIYQSTGDPAARAPGRRGALYLELTDDRGQSRLRRELRVEGGDCRARAEAMALVVYRFFARLGGTVSESLPPSPPPPASPPPATAVARPASPSPPAPPSSPAPAVLLASTPARPPAQLRLSLEAGAGLWTRRPGAATTVFGLRVAWARVEGAFSVLAPGAPAAERLADAGEVEGSALGMATSLGLVWQGARMRLSGGPLSVVCRERGRSRKIAISAENARTTAALGLAAGGSWRLWRGLHLGFETGLAHAVLGNRFVVGGWGPVLAPPAWQGLVQARLGYAFSR